MNFSAERAAVLCAATAAFGLSALLRKIAVDRLHPLRFQVVAAVVYLAFLPFYIYIASKHVDEPLDWKGVGWAALATVIASFGGIMFGFALRSSNDAGMVTALSSASPVITLMLSFLVLGERPTTSGAVGCALVLAGIMVISFK